MRFDELGLIEPVVRAVAAEGYTAPTPIQAKAIPPVLAGRDLIGCAQTGTGKTGAFALPVLQRLAEQHTHSPQRPNHKRRGGGHGRPPRALVLAPTRELATQIHESFVTYGDELPLRHAVIFGGVNQNPQVRKLKQGVDVLIATPGRLLDLMQQGCVDVRRIEVLILDEADRMLDMGFIHDLRKIVEQVPDERQTLLFSATMPPEIRKLAESILRDPETVQVDPVASTVDAIDQSVYLVTKKSKPQRLVKLIEEESMGRTLVFSRTKHGADKLVRVLRKSGIHAAAIHGNKSQNARTRALDGFKSGRTPILIATDIASRGIDVEEITHVVNFDLPNEPETYVHRIGRTARAGASGKAMSFCDVEELGDLRAIERLIDKTIDVAERGYDEPAVTPAPSPRYGGGRPRPPRNNAQRRRPRRRPRNKRSRSTAA